MSYYNKKDYEFIVREAEKLYKNSCDDNLEDFPLSEREKFHKNGNREDFERLYFKRRDYLSATALLALFDDSYISELERILIAVCKEYCWVLPAHTTGKKEEDEKAVDLFVAETSFALAEICSVFRNKLSQNVYSTVKGAIEERLLHNYLKGTFWWEGCNMNWSAVCGGNIGGALLYMFPDEFIKIKQRIIKTLECYIDGFTDDGFCLEGPGYWIYGFTAYTVFADLLYRFSDGKEDLFSSLKVKRIAAYGGSCFLKGNTCLSFSDSKRNFKADIALQQYLYGRCSDSVDYIGKEKLCLYPSNTKWTNYYRAIIWQNEEKTTDKERRRVIYSPYANQLIVNGEHFSFAFKGGSNDEPHNHNDLGSFIYSDDDGQVFCDLGSGRYTKDYFDDEKRYGIFCNSSFSHSVPIIDGKGQTNGKEITAKLSFEGNSAVCDIRKAYDEAGIKSLIRQAVIKENGVAITDSFDSDSEMSVTERFVSLRKAGLSEGILTFGNTRLEYPEERVSLSVKEESHTPHEYGSEDIRVYCYDFLLKKGVNEITFEITTE